MPPPPPQSRARRAGYRLDLRHRPRHRPAPRPRRFHRGAALAQLGRGRTSARGRAWRGELYPGRLADDGECRRLVAEVLVRHGRLDVLVNNAGISGIIPHGALKEATPAVWRALYDVNVIAPFVLVAEAEAALRAAAERGRPGCVLNISSHAGVRPKGASIPYAASKAALNHATRLLAVALAPAIRVNALAPGLVDHAPDRELGRGTGVVARRGTDAAGRAAGRHCRTGRHGRRIRLAHGEVIVADGRPQLDVIRTLARLPSSGPPRRKPRRACGTPVLLLSCRPPSGGKT